MEEPMDSEKTLNAILEYEAELIKLYGTIDRDSFQETETVAGADLSALVEHETNFGKMIEEMFSKLPEERKLIEGAANHERYDAMIKSLYADLKTNLQTTSRVTTNGATTDDLVAGQSTLHTLEQASEALCDGMPPTSARTDLECDI
jgi:hypothetical protein